MRALVYYYSSMPIFDLRADRLVYYYSSIYYLAQRWRFAYVIIGKGKRKENHIEGNKERRISVEKVTAPIPIPK